MGCTPILAYIPSGGAKIHPEIWIPVGRADFLNHNPPFLRGF
jgi:hypothetical protein